MAKYAQIAQATKAMNDAIEAKRMGNLTMAQERYQAAMAGLDAIGRLTDVQVARQNMEFGKQVQPFKVTEAETAAKRGVFELTQEQEKAQRDRDVLARVKAMINEDPRVFDELATVAERGAARGEAQMRVATVAEQQKQGYIPARVGAQVAGEEATREEAITRELTATAERPYIEEKAAAEGKKAEYERLSTEIDLSQLPATEIMRRNQIERNAEVAKYERGAAETDIEFYISEKKAKIKLLKTQIDTLKKRGDLYGAQMLALTAKREGKDMATLQELRALASDIQSAYMAIAKLDAGEDLTELVMKLGAKSGVKLNTEGMERDASKKAELRQLLVVHVEMLRSLINRHGWQYDATSTPPLFRTLTESEARMPPGGGASVQYEQYRKDLPESTPQYFQEPQQPGLGVPPPTPGQEGDTDVFERILNDVFPE